MSTTLIPNSKKLLNVIKELQRVLGCKPPLRPARKAASPRKTDDLPKPFKTLQPSSIPYFEPKATTAGNSHLHISPNSSLHVSPIHNPVKSLKRGDKLLASVGQDVLGTILNNNPSARGFIQGYIAEECLMAQLKGISGISDVSKIPDRHARKGDILFKYRGKEFTIEVKSLKSNSRKEEFLEGGFSGVVGVKKTDSPFEKSLGTSGIKGTCHISPGEFDILAISTYNVTGTWDFYFLASVHLPRLESDPSKVKTSFRVNAQTTPCLYQDVLKLLSLQATTS